jgi:hypothetical protein
MTGASGSYPRGLQIETLPNNDVVALYDVTNSVNAASAIMLKNTSANGTVKLEKYFSSKNGSGNSSATVSAPTFTFASSSTWHVFYLCKSSNNNVPQLDLVHARTLDSGSSWSYEVIVSGGIQEPVLTGPSGQPVVNNMSAVADSVGNLYLLHWQDDSTGGGKKIVLKKYSSASGSTRNWSSLDVSDSSLGYDFVTPQLSLDTSALRMYYVRLRKLTTFSNSTVMKVGELIGRHLPLQVGATLSSETRFLLGTSDKDFVLGRGAVAAP